MVRTLLYQGFGFLCTDTTRLPKKNEEDGKEYHFISTEEMTRAISANEFLEFGSYQGNMFGTKFETVHQIHKQGKIAILDIEPQVGGHGKVGLDGAGGGEEQSSWESLGGAQICFTFSGVICSKNSSTGLREAQRCLLGRMYHDS